MDDDHPVDDAFERAMRNMGVVPLAGKSGRKPSRGRRPARDGTPEEEAPARLSDDEEDSLFLQNMAELGVDTAAAEEPPEPSGESTAPTWQDEPLDDATENSLFLDTMEMLLLAPDKDDAAVARRPSPDSAKARELKRPKRARQEVEDTLDLHGKTSEAALRRLESFVFASRKAGLRRILVVTGKGLHSDRGRAILREKVERWLRGQTRKTIKAYQQAPRELGGRGAYVIFLR